MAVTWQERFGTISDWSSGCPICSGETFLSLTVNQLVSPFRSADQPRCPCWQLFVAMQALWVGGYPKGHLELNFDSAYPLDRMPEDTKQKWYARFPDSYAWEMSEDDERALKRWTEGAHEVAVRGLSIVIYGDKGTGKSALATTITKEFVKRRGLDSCGLIKGFSSQWLVADSLYADLGRGWRAKDVLGPCMQADILVVDDLRMAYKGFLVAEYVERLHALLQHRAGNNLPTIITTNKIAQGQDHESNAITEFLGVTRDSIPEAYGKFRYVRLTNMALRPTSEWT